MKVHKVTLLIIDTDDLGADGVREVLENTRYANHCISPDVKAIETVEVKWSDDHPLNLHATCEAEYQRLFTKGEK